MNRLEIQQKSSFQIIKKIIKNYQNSKMIFRMKNFKIIFKSKILKLQKKIFGLRLFSWRIISSVFQPINHNLNFLFEK